MLEHVPGWLGHLLRNIRAGSDKLVIAQGDLKSVGHDLALASPAFADGARLPERFTADGAGVSPPLIWREPPEGTHSLALIVEDPDAPATRPLVHATVWNLSPDTLRLAEGAKPDDDSSTDAMIAVLKPAFEHAGVTVTETETVRVAALNIKPGVTSDEGDGDAWPALREKILAHDILIFGGTIWLGQIGSIAKRVLERMDAFLEETDDAGRMPSSSKVAVAAVVGNEDGAHFSTALLFQALNDVGWTIPAVGAVYWVGEAFGSTDFKDLKETPETVIKTAKTLAGNAAHLAGLLKEKPYPGGAD